MEGVNASLSKTRWCKFLWLGKKSAVQISLCLYVIFLNWVVWMCISNFSYTFAHQLTINYSSSNLRTKSFTSWKSWNEAPQINQSYIKVDCVRFSTASVISRLKTRRHWKKLNFPFTQEQTPAKTSDCFANHWSLTSVKVLLHDM